MTLINRRGASHRLRLTVLGFAAGPAGPALAQTTTAPAPSERAVSEQAFQSMAEVLRHPRCMNCHTVTEFPRQGNDRHRHQQMVA
jgi:hypothetical protein